MKKETFDPFPFEDKQNGKNIKKVAFKYLSYWKWFTFSIILLLISAFFYLKLQAPQYTIQSSILIKNDQKELGKSDLLKQLKIFTSDKEVENEIEILKSFTLMDKVVTGLNLNVRYFTTYVPKLVTEGFQRLNLNTSNIPDNLFRDRELYSESPVTLEVKRPNNLIYTKPLLLTIRNKNQLQLNGVNIQSDKEVETPYGLIIVRLVNKYSNPTKIKILVQPSAVMAESLIENLQIKSNNKTSALLMMNIVDQVPQRGCDVLNKIVAYYNLEGVEDKNKIATSTLAIIDARLKQVSEELGDVEKNVEIFKSGNRITDLSEESRIFLSNVQGNDVELNKVKIQQQVLNEIIQYVHSKGDNTGNVPSTLGINEPVLLSLINDLVELEGKRMSMSKMVTSDNPMLLSMNDQIAALRRSIGENIVSLQSSLAITRQQYEDRNAKMEAKLKTIPGKERIMVEVSRKQSIKSNLYTYLLQKREENVLSFSSADTGSRIIDQPHSVKKPVSTKTSLTYCFFSMIGFVLPFGAISIMNLFNDKIIRRKEINENTKAAIFGEVSYVKHDEPLVDINKDSIFRAQMQTMCSNLAYLTPGQKLQSILFTSSIGGEGKSFLSLNLGASLAMMDKKTVILDFDLRKPNLKTELNKTAGISNYLIGEAELNDIIFPVVQQPNLSIISSGHIPHDPRELMISGRIKALFEALRAEFDYIIIDASSFGVVTDAQLLNEYADVTLYVLRRGYTPKSYLSFIDDLYKGKMLKHINLIFNGSKECGL